MFSIDKEKFGNFVASLRKNLGLTQKDLAQKLFISDKAVSKWERGLGMPDITLLVPLAQILEISVTELLSCELMEQKETMNSEEVEQVVKKAIEFSQNDKTSLNRERGKRGFIFGACIMIAVLEILIIHMLDYSWAQIALNLLTLEILAAIFGIYSWVFAKEKLPTYYDENTISAYSDGFFRLNLPGVRINNSNWVHILQSIRTWCVIVLILLPIVDFMFWNCVGDTWTNFGSFLWLGICLLGLFVPMYFVAKKYE